jgi:primosomal protein N' (replication factor Y) (superfamily II helicase)
MTSDAPHYVDVVFPTSLETPLTYRVPEEWRSTVVPGKRVLVPLGARMVTGYLVGTCDRSTVADTKDLREILDPEPLLDAHLLELTRWVADYYLSSWGEVIRVALPPGIDSLTRQIVRITTGGAAAMDADQAIRPGERELLAFLRVRGEAPLPTLTQRWKRARAMAHSLARRGLVELSAELRPPRIQALRVPHCLLASGVDPEATSLSPRASKQRAILRALAKTPSGLPKGEAAAGSPAALAALIKRHLVQIRDVEVSRDPFTFPGGRAPAESPRQLTAGQAEAVQLVRRAITERQFLPLLLHGVTGSGKTEVYLQAIDAALAEGRQALVLVPEIALTPLTVQRFLARFGGRVAVLHSGLKGGERFDAWRRVRRGEADIVVGARSAVFAPLPRLGIVVVDEEHEPSYKQEESPRYHGRDVAVMRAKLLGAPVILGSATPSLESVERARAGRYVLVRLPERIEERPLPRVEIVDLRRVDGGERLLSPALCAALGECLGRGEQSLIFLNRRGFSTLLLCQECGATLGCPRCSVSLTYHAGRGRLCCHTCDFERRPPERCPECQGSKLHYLGYGTQQLEAAVRARFPKARVARMDRDTTRHWREAQRILEELQQGKIDILVGTQMIGKGHDVPNVTLVGVVSADMALNLPDFRAGERAFALFTQVVGRAGRGERPGMALIQTYNPDHYILRAVQAQDYQALWEAESPLRRDQHLPPFARAVLAVLSSPVAKAAEAAAVELARLLRETGIGASGLSGPAPAPLYRVRERYRWHILMRGQDVKRLHARVSEAARRFRVSPAARGVRLDLDVDPASLC